MAVRAAVVAYAHGYPSPRQDNGKDGKHEGETPDTASVARNNKVARREKRVVMITKTMKKGLKVVI